MPKLSYQPEFAFSQIVCTRNQAILERGRLFWNELDRIIPEMGEKTARRQFMAHLKEAFGPAAAKEIRREMLIAELFDIELMAAPGILAHFEFEAIPTAALQKIAALPTTDREKVVAEIINYADQYSIRKDANFKQFLDGILVSFDVTHWQGELNVELKKQDIHSDHRKEIKERAIDFALADQKPVSVQHVRDAIAALDEELAEIGTNSRCPARVSLKEVHQVSLHLMESAARAGIPECTEKGFQTPDGLLTGEEAISRVADILAGGRLHWREVPEAIAA